MLKPCCVSKTHLTILSAIVLIWLEKQYSCLPSFSAVIETVPVDCFKCFPKAKLFGSASYTNISDRLETKTRTNPKIYVKIPSSSHLICHCHLDDQRQNLVVYQNDINYFVIHMQVFKKTLLLRSQHFNNMAEYGERQAWHKEYGESPYSRHVMSWLSVRGGCW